MAKRQKKEVYLPPEIIHHIQSFFNAKESAQTSLLSKSWLAAWSTRPVLIFDEDDFPKHNLNVQHPFPVLCMKTLNRYKTLNLKPDKFVLGMQGHQTPLAAEFIISALKLGVNEIVLKFVNSPGFPRVQENFDLPAQVFASTTLTRLSVDTTYNIGVVMIVNRVLCSRLTSLFLRDVHTTDVVIRDILLGCPLIENLGLVCKGLQNVNVSKLLNLVEFCAGLGVRVEFIDGRKVTEFHYLRKLDFQGVKLSDDFFTKFSFMFPCIEDFTLNQCVGRQVINISSHSLRHLSLSTTGRLKKVQLNVPNITKFTFHAFYFQETWAHHFEPLPFLSFDNVSRDWESDVHLLWESDRQVVDVPLDVTDPHLLVDLRNFLIQLTPSKISLCAAFSAPAYSRPTEELRTRDIMLGEEIPIPSLPVVENLTVCDVIGSTSESFLLGLVSRTCSPKVITKCKIRRCLHIESLISAFPENEDEDEDEDEDEWY